MQISKSVPVLLLATSAIYMSQAIAAPADEEGYYGVARVISAERKARNMDSSARPGIGSFVSGDDSQKDMTGSIGVGYRFGNGWRVEGELTLPQSDTFTSGSTAFPASLNQHHIDSRRVMLNAYRDLRITEKLAIYGSAGLGLARLESKGWQGNESRQYGASTQTNLAWSVGEASVFAVPIAWPWTSAIATLIWAIPKVAGTTLPMPAACKMKK